MSEAPTNPETGVEAEANAPTDDHSTDQFDRMEAPDDDAEDDAKPEGEGDDDASDADKAKPAEDDDLEEIELTDGRKVRVPKEVALQRLMERDYRQKTQQLAETRRALETEQQTWESEREASRAALPEEHRRVAVLSHTLETIDKALDQPLDARGLTLRTIDWPAFRQAAAGSEEMAEIYQDYRARYDAANQDLADLKTELGKATDDLKSKEDTRLQGQREAQAASLAKAQEETGRVLAAKIEGWGPAKARDVVVYAHQTYGVAPGEMAEATDPRIWFALHDALTAKAEAAKLREALKKHQTATKNSKDQEVKPAVTAKGSGAANARDPATARGDALSTDEWKRRRLAQKAAKRS